MFILKTYHPHEKCCFKKRNMEKVCKNALWNVALIFINWPVLGRFVEMIGTSVMKELILDILLYMICKYAHNAIQIYQPNFATLCSVHNEWSFPLRVSSVNGIKSKSHLPKTSLMESFNFCAVLYQTWRRLYMEIMSSVHCNVDPSPMLTIFCFLGTLFRSTTISYSLELTSCP